MRPVVIHLAALALGASALAAAAALHAGVACWIQGLNYLVAAVPLALASSHAARWRAMRLPRARRIAVWYALTFAAIVAYSLRSVEAHRALVAGEEQALAPAIAALEAHRAAGGRYPATLAEIGATPPPALRFTVFYAPAGAAADGFRLGFVHNLLLEHVYRSDTRAWTDAVVPR